MKKVWTFVWISCCIIFVISVLIMDNKLVSEGRIVIDNEGAHTGNLIFKITQFGNKDGAQMTGYTVEGENNGLIIIDGGWYNDDFTQLYYKQAIESHNNTVDAWILTHFDVDHAGAFLKIREEIPNLKIKRLYVQGFPDIELCKEKAPWEEDWSIYEKCLEIPEKETIKVIPGYELENIIPGLKFKVLSVYEPWMDVNCTSLLNNGSIVFKLIGRQESMLFCGDVSDGNIEERIMERFKDDLPSDYIQVAHHGNSPFSDEFYKIVDPKIASFDAPNWLFYNTNNTGWYTIEHTKKLFEDMGVQMISFDTAPNFIEMK